jgi:plasmid maintenance system antidote protein VapI
MVVIDVRTVEQFRRNQTISRMEFYKKLGVHPATGANILNGKPVHLSIAKRLASIMGIKSHSLIRSWRKVSIA